MANRFPLVLDTTDNNKIKEIQSGDNLNLTDNSITGVQNITALGTIDAADIKVNGNRLVAQTFNDLTDTPSTFVGAYNHFVKVKADGTGLEYKPLSDLGNIDIDTITVDTGIIPSVNQVGYLGTLANRFDRVVATSLYGNLRGYNGELVFNAETSKISYAALQGAPTFLSEFVNDVGYLKSADVDISIADLFNEAFDNGVPFERDLNGRLIADDSSIAYDNETDRFNNPKIAGEIQWIGQGNDTLTKIFAEDGNVVINSAATRSLMLQNYSTSQGEYRNRGVTLSCNVDQALLSTSMQLQIGDASGVEIDRAVKIIGEAYIDSFGDPQITDITIGGVYDFPETIGLPTPGKGEIWRVQGGWFETLDTDSLVVNNDLELKGHIISDDSTILVDTEQGKFFGKLEGDVVGSVFADDSTLLVDGVAGKIIGNYENGTSTIGSTRIVSYDVEALQDLNTVDSYVNGKIYGGATSNAKNLAIGSTPPTDSTGADGDRAGMIAFDSTSIYYCIANWASPGTANIWVKQDWGTTGAWS